MAQGTTQQEIAKRRLAALEIAKQSRQESQASTAAALPIAGGLLGALVGTLVAPGAGTVAGAQIGGTLGGVAGGAIAPQQSQQIAAQGQTVANTTSAIQRLIQLGEQEQGISAIPPPAPIAPPAQAVPAPDPRQIAAVRLLQETQ